MKSGSVERLALEPQPTSVTHHISTTKVAMRPRIVRRSPLTAQRLALKLRATRPPAKGCGHNTPLPLERSPSASFRRMLGGNRQSVRIPQLHESLRARVPPDPECRLVAVGEHDVLGGKGLKPPQSGGVTKLQQ